MNTQKTATILPLELALNMANEHKAFIDSHALIKGMLGEYRIERLPKGNAKMAIVKRGENIGYF